MPPQKNPIPMTQSPESMPRHDSQISEPERKRRKLAGNPASNKTLPQAKDKKTDFRAVVVSGTVGRGRTLKRAEITNTVFATKERSTGNKESLGGLMEDVQEKLKAFRDVNQPANLDGLGLRSQNSAVDPSTNIDILGEFANAVSAAKHMMAVSKAESDDTIRQQLQAHKTQVGKLEISYSKARDSREHYRADLIASLNQNDKLSSDLVHRKAEIQKMTKHHERVKSHSEELRKLEMSLNEKEAEMNIKLEKQRKELEEQNQQAIFECRAEAAVKASSAAAEAKLNLDHDMNRLGEMHDAVLEVQRQVSEEGLEKALNSQRLDLEDKHRDLNLEHIRLKKDHDEALESQRLDLEDKSREASKLQHLKLKKEYDEALESQRVDLEEKQAEALVLQHLKLKKEHDEALESQRLSMERIASKATDEQHERLQKEDHAAQTRIRKEAEDAKVIACDATKLEMENSRKWALHMKDSEHDRLMSQMKMKHTIALDKQRFELETDYQDAIDTMFDFSTAGIDELVRICADVVDDGLTEIENRQKARLEVQEASFEAQKSRFINANKVALDNLAFKYEQAQEEKLSELRLQLNSDHWRSARDIEQEHHKQLSNIQVKIDDAVDHLKSAEEQERKLRSTVQSTSEELETSKRKEHETQVQLADLQCKIDIGVKEFDLVSGQLERAKQEATTTQQQLSDTTVKHDELALERNLLKDDVRQLHEERASIHSEVQRLLGQIEENRSLLKECKRISTTQANELDELRRERDLATDRNGQIQKDLEESRKALDEKIVEVALKDAESVEAHAKLEVNGAAQRSLEQKLDSQAKDLRSMRHEKERLEAQSTKADEEHKVALREKDITIHEGRMALFLFQWDRIIQQQECEREFFHAIQKFIENHEGRGSVFNHQVRQQILPGCVVVLPQRRDAVFVTQTSDLRFRVRQHRISECRTFVHDWMRWIRLESEGQENVEYLKLVKDKNQPRNEWLVRTFSTHSPTEDDDRRMHQLA